MEKETYYERIERFYNENENAFWEWDLKTGKVFFSTQYYKMLGYEPENETKSINFWLELIHPEDRKKIVADLEKEPEKCLPYNTEFRMKCKNGEWKWISGKAKVYKYDEDGKPSFVIGTHTDISELKEKEKIIKRELEFETVISSISSRLLGEISTNEAIYESLKELGLNLMVDKSYLFILNEDSSSMSNIYEWARNKSNIKLQSIPSELISFIKQEFKTKEIIKLDNLNNFPEEKQIANKLLNEHKHKSFIVTPVRVHKKIIGFIGINYSNESPIEIENLLKIVSRIIGNFLERKENIKKTKNLNRILKGIRDVNYLITHEKNRDKLIKRACDSLVDTKGFSNAWINLLDENQNYLTSAEAGLGEKFIPLREDMKNGNFTECARKTLKTQRIVINENPETECKDCFLSENYEEKCSFSISLSYEKRVYGLLTVSVPRIYGNDIEERELFEDIAQDISFALHNLRLEDEKKLTDIALVNSEKKFKEKIKELLSHEEEVKKIELSDVIDSEIIQILMDSLYNTSKIPMAILDINGKVLVHTGWQDICTKFHRANKESLKNCMESDKYLSKGVKKGEFKGYKCKNNLLDFVTPIIIGNRHLGNYFYGQILYKEENLNYELFKKQAKKFGFNEIEYLKALEKVPRKTKEEVSKIMDFFSKFADMIATLG